MSFNIFIDDYLSQYGCLIQNYSFDIEKFHTGIKLEETMMALLFEGILVGSEEDRKHGGAAS